MNKQELATKIWATANELRKNIKASEYKTTSSASCSTNIFATRK